MNSHVGIRFGPMTPTEALVWWLEHHGRNDELAAAAAGVTARTLSRWKAANAVPAHVAALIDQIRYGAALRTSTERGHGVFRSEWTKLLQPIVEAAHAKFAQKLEKLDGDWSRIWRRNRSFRPGFKLPLPKD